MARRRRPSLPIGERIYAVGDIHGRLDLLGMLFEAIEADISTRSPAHNRVIILGDFIDRGPHSAQIANIFAAQRATGDFIVLKGNHEAALSAGLKGDRAALDLWVDHGGDATLRSFGASEDEIYPPDTRMLLGAVRRIVPKHIAQWLDHLPINYRAGDYLFVHAGIRPGVPIDRQADDDMLWIREEFTESDANHGVIVVHGHTVSRDGVTFQRNRIGIDTGACDTDRLSALGLEGTAVWVLDTASSS